MKIVVVGYGPGGAAAAVAARMFNSEVDIKIVTQETLESHRKPGVSLALEVPDTNDLAIKDWSWIWILVSTSKSGRWQSTLVLKTF